MRSYPSSELDVIDPLVMFGPKMATPIEAPKPKKSEPAHDWSCATTADLMHHLSPQMMKLTGKAENKAAVRPSIEQLRQRLHAARDKRVLTTKDITMLEAWGQQWPSDVFKNASDARTMIVLLEDMFITWTLDELLECRSTMKTFNHPEVARLLKYAINTLHPVQNVTLSIEARKKLLGDD